MSPSTSDATTTQTQANHLTESILEARFQELQRQGKGKKGCGLAHKQNQNPSWEEDVLQVPASYSSILPSSSPLPDDKTQDKASMPFQPQ